jgi:hypothetical protein
MNKETAVNFVIEQLGKQVSENEILLRLCEKTGLSWPEAEQFLRQVQSEQKRTITLRQSPLLLIMSIGFILVGLGLFFYGGYRGIFAGLLLALGGSLGLKRIFSDLLG